MKHMRAVIVTGSSTGIGAAVSALLADKGFTVFAGVRTEADARRTGDVHSRVRPLLLDVTKSASIADAAERVRTSGIPLHGVVNNAGVAIGGPLEYLPLDDVRRQFEVNVFGVLAVTQAMLPMLHATRGRVAVVGSIGGRLAAPFVGPYGASKAAIAALTDSLRMELAPSGIAVSLFEFAAVKTPIWAKGRALKDELAGRLPDEALKQYGHAIQAIGHQIEREERAGMEPAVIARKIYEALTVPRPRERYIIGRAARAQSIVALLPPRMRDRLIRGAMNLP
jgi:NAD(P)-dependent dehydrogenase (short-subunit alcohol dehydrogenase family)